MTVWQGISAGVIGVLTVIHEYEAAFSPTPSPAFSSLLTLILLLHIRDVGPTTHLCRFPLAVIIGLLIAA